jgi:uncharacterized membrane protein
MEQLTIDLLRWLHILSGSLALLAGPIAMFNQDGGKTHRLSGKIYVWSMYVIFITSTSLSIYRSNLFLFLIGIFSMYLVIGGHRALSLKLLHKGQKAARIDWAILMISAVAGIGLVAMGIYLILAKSNSAGLVPGIFGLIMLSGTRQDYKRYTVPPTQKNHWLLKHISGMMGGYIATVTAFLVNNWQTDPPFISWLLPTVIITPFIVIISRKFQRGSGKVQLP